MKTKNQKQELVVVATKYKNKPIKVDYYTKKGKSIPKNNVVKEANHFGVKFFHFI